VVSKFVIQLSFFGWVLDAVSRILIAAYDFKIDDSEDFFLEISGLVQLSGGVR
jgi:hypothetical protein